MMIVAGWVLYVFIGWLSYLLLALLNMLPKDPDDKMVIGILMLSFWPIADIVAVILFIGTYIVLFTEKLVARIQHKGCKK